MISSDVLRKSSYFNERVSALKEVGRTSFPGMIGSSSAAILASLSDEFQNSLIIVSSTQKAEILRSEIELFSGKSAIVFPAPDDNKDLVGERLSVLERLSRGERLVMVAPIRAVMSKTSRELKSIRISEHQDIRMESVIGRLVDFGYKRFEIVGEHGEFSVRGGIVDIFPLDFKQPVRVELVGDQIESIRYFDAYSQRSIEKIPEALILPAQEAFEATIFEHLGENSLIVFDEMIEVSGSMEKLAGNPTIVGKRKRADLSSFLEPGMEAVFQAPPSYINRLSEIPKEAVVVSRHAVRLKEELPEMNVTAGEIRGGFVFGGLEVISDRELFGEEIVSRRAKAAPREGVADELLADLKIGDYAVHENYGIGIYRGMQELPIEGIRQEYLLIEYAEGDKLYVPPHMAGLVEKYEGGREAHPRLSRLGTREWLRARDRVKQSVRDMTQELLQLYAAREKLEGYAFLPDDIWQKELEATFPFEETPDQLKAIFQVKKDMESPNPMDRLVCGDVGYGKTEVAIRAAAKAVSSGKQVAILAPTTILVEQHYNNFKQRFQNLPFVVEMLSRFRSAGEQKEIVKLLNSGGVDIVIGTHRLLSKDIKFKDLGLLIVDEEQKFGVTHKEKLKKIKASVDVLTLSATPIPRTLYFSLSGIREMSMISTPPVDRSPIRTYVLPFSEKVIREAILHELDRGGQVYFLHNFVETIAGMALKLSKLVPEAKLAVAHGQMDEKRLEKTMLDFLSRKFDVLICTSIIESGLDIPNVNTILIDQADRLGLSQLYQIRGRVGRSAARAYAYLFYHPQRVMTEGAIERLKAIQEFTALGSGYKLAMRDLEIRGAGNLLGAEQSGHIYEVGFDLYCELLGEAAREIKGEKIISPREVEIDLKVEASIPSDYAADERQRIALYRRMNLIASVEALEELKKELEDRFGKIPAQLEALLRILDLKITALNAGVKSIKEEKDKIRIEYLPCLPAGRSKKVKLIEIEGGDKISSAKLNIAG